MHAIHLYSSAVSDKGLNEKRPHNEDSYLEMPSKGLFAVADGVGGAQAGDVASQMAVEILGEAFGNQQENIDVEELMKIAIKRANTAIYQMSNELSQLRTMATTVVTLQISGNIATIGHVGDSRLYRLDSKGNLFRETQDHSVVEEEVRAGRMTAAQAANHPSRNVISRALGAESSVEIDMKTIMFEPNTMFLLCSDGITRHLSDIEIREMMLTCQNPTEVCREMKNLCYNRGAEDNLTAVVIKTEAEITNTEDDERTIPTVRSQTFNSHFVEQNLEDIDAPTRELSPTQIQEAQYNQTREFNTSSSTLSVPTNVSKEGAIFRVEGASGVASDDDVRQYEQMQAERAHIIGHSQKENAIGRIFKTLFWMAVGAVLGIAAYYGLTDFGNKQTVVNPESNVSQNTVSPFNTFEENRRMVDKQPKQFLETIGGNAKEAEDFYLIGRANLNMLNYKLAGEAFRKAKELLPSANDANRQVLTTEINMALAMLADDDAVKRFEKERSSVSSVQSNSAETTTSNSAKSNTSNIKTEKSDSNSNTKSANTNANAKPSNTNVITKPNLNSGTVGSQKDN